MMLVQHRVRTSCALLLKISFRLGLPETRAIQISLLGRVISCSPLLEAIEIAPVVLK
jgi:hypothetical protein